MIKTEFDEVAKLIVSIRRDVETLTAKCAALEAERNDLAAHVSAHVDALKQSNAQCGEYLRQNEQLHSELVNVRAALASVSAERDSLKRTLKEWEEAETAPHARVDPPIRMGLISETGPAVFVRIGAPPTDDIADHVVPPVLPMCRTCHECGGVLRPSRAAGSHSVLCCRTERCSRINTAWQDDVSPYHGPCKSAAPVRHE